MASQTELEFADFDSNSIWNEIYQRMKNEASLTTLGDEFSTKIARDPENRKLNRYRDVSPYDHSRVVLSGEEDYINASYVEVPEAGRKYILTQGPLEHTICDFWQMVWEQETRAIVMLNRVIEKGTLKCSQYWPLGSNYGYDDDMDLPECGLRVTLKNEEDFQHFSTRSFELENTESGETREILHFHYTTWPDFGVPSSPDAFLHFLQAVRQAGSLDRGVGPAVVHCSAGIGRSGSFCLVDSCLVKVESEASLGSINVRQNLINMRSFRMGLVQTADQLRFSYLAIIQGAHAILNGSGLKIFQSQMLTEGVPPPPPQRSSSLPPVAKPPAQTRLEPEDEPPPLPPKQNSPPSQVMGGESSDESFDDLIDRDEKSDEELIADHESEDEEEVLQLRRRIREERKQQTQEKIKAMKEKQKNSEKWRPYRSYLKPSVYFGIAVLVGIAGVALYKYFI